MLNKQNSMDSLLGWTTLRAHGPLEKTMLTPGIKGEIALDTPSPYFNEAENRLFLYYSTADRTDGIWKIALTTFDIS